MGKRTICLALCLALCCLCAGCGGFQKDGSFTYLLPQNVTSLDPQTATGAAAEMVISSLFEGLCRIDKEGDTVAGVATRWESNSDSTQFTFHLRKNARWSDGSPLTAQDFVFGIGRALTANTGSLPEELLVIQGARAVAAGEADVSALGVVAEDDNTLVIRLEKSNPDFPSLTAGTHFMPCNQAYFDSCEGHYGQSSEYLLTNGPFALSSVYAWQTDSGSRSISVVRSNTYRGSREVLPASITFLIDYNSAYDEEPVATLTSGAADVMTLTQDQAQQAREQGCIFLSLEDAVSGLLLNPQSDKLASTQLRSLFFRTLNRAQLLAQRPEAAEAPGIMPACVTWNGQDYYQEGAQAYPPEDQEGAREEIPSLLRELDLEEVPSITVLCLDDPESVAVANTLLSCWNSALGNAFNLERVSASQLQSRVASGNYEAALYTLRAGGTTPYNVLQAFESTASPTLLENPDFDQLLSTLNFDLASYQSAESYLQELYVFYPLFREETYYGTSPVTRGISISPDQTVDFTGARKK